MLLSITLLGAACIASVTAAPQSLTVTDGKNSPQCAGLKALSPKCAPVEANHRREIFYVGGHYEVNPQTQQRVLADKTYVEKLTPPKVSKPYPLVFFHGGGFSGAVSHDSKRLQGLLTNL